MKIPTALVKMTLEKKLAAARVPGPKAPPAERSRYLDLLFAAKGACAADRWSRENPAK